MDPDLPATPLTEPASPSTRVMDSDDDFMSDASSQGDFEGTQDSDDDVSLGEGTLYTIFI